MGLADSNHDRVGRHNALRAGSDDGADKVIFTHSNSAKAMSQEDLADMYTEICGKMYQTAASLGEALRLAKSAVSKEDLICITGSFYLISQAKVRFR